MTPYWDYSVKGYASNRHPRHQYGELLLWTTHRTESSMQVEVEAWKTRMNNRDREVAYVEIIDHNAGTTRTIYPEASK